MITINLSDEQARKLLESLGWRIDIGNISDCHIDADVAKEMFIQLEQKMMPVGTEQANLTAWHAEAGYTAKAVEEWKRKNELIENFE